MKYVTTILLFIWLFACNAQEPDTLIYYTQSDIDSIINQYENIIGDCFNKDTIDIWKDDIYFRVRDGRLAIEITKHGYDFWFNAYDSNTGKLINTNYVDFESIQTLK